MLSSLQERSLRQVGLIDYEGVVEEFRRYSYGSEEQARSYLDRCDWDLDRAMDVFWFEEILTCDL